MRYLQLIIIMIMVGLASCTKEVEFDGEQTNPLLVVNGLQQVGQPARLRVEKSVFFLDDQPDCRVKDVQVDLYVNGAFKESLQVRDSLEMEQYYEWYEEGEVLMEHLYYAFNYCEGNYLIEEGDKLRFEVRSSEFAMATAEVTMPEAPQVISFDTLRIEHGYDYGMSVYFALKLDDPSGSDYYNLFPQGALSGFTSTDPVLVDLTALEDIEDIFGENQYYAWGKYNMFTDKFFDGTEYSLSMDVHYYGDMFYEPFILEVTRVDANFYQYYRSFSTYQSNDQESLIGMFTEPVQVYSNVRNGIGVVGAQSRPVIMTIDLTEN